jgi:cation diffusion facilitator CzcD-associated flavoprotein CzcO
VAIDMIRQSNGRNFVILEKGHRVGGTWSDNEYPGACCDGTSRHGNSGEFM